MGEIYAGSWYFFFLERKEKKRNIRHISHLNLIFRYIWGYI
jgi:hypothetical protein